MLTGHRHLFHTNLSIADRARQTQLSRIAISLQNHSFHGGTGSIQDDTLSLESTHRCHMDAVSQLVKDSIISSMKLSLSV